MSRKQHHRISSTRAILLVFVLCTVQTGPVFAKAEIGDALFLVQEPSAVQDPVPADDINVELLFIALPAGGLEFTVDTLKEFSLDGPGSQFEGMDLLIKNYSKIPIQVEISQVTKVAKGDLHFEDKFSDQEKQSSQLADQIPKVDPIGTAILTLGVSDQTYGSAQGPERRTLLPGGSGGIYITEISAKGVIYP